MLLIPTRVDRSSIHGLGLFATETIPPGTPIWRWTAGFDRTFTTQEVERLPTPAREHLSHYGYLDPATSHWFLGGDLAIFMNHSERPNTGAPENQGAAAVTFALRTIEPGEEITCDYRTFDNSPKPIPALDPGQDRPAVA